MLQHAVREVGEETGLQIVLGRPLSSVTYPLSNGTTKVSHYWAATVAHEGSAAMTARPEFKVSKHEVDEQRWVAADRAMRMLTRRSARAPRMRRSGELGSSW